MMKGKTVIVTGANTGIGFQTALALANLQATVIAIARSETKARETADQLRTLTGNNEVQGYSADLASQKQIRMAAEKILTDFQKVDVLINNAAAWYSRHELTEEGIEKQLAINHLAPFLLTHLLLPAMAPSTDSRVITVSSDSHFHGRIHFDDIHLKNNYHGLRAYAQSKLGNVLFTYEFERRKKPGQPVINAVQPGLVKTNIGLKHTISLHNLVWRLRRLGGVSPGQGAATSVYLASSEECRGASGQYWDRRKPKKSSPDSYDANQAGQLWELSEKLCGINRYFP
jgi:NAD(P)-dependent dehydrogenase (short-subunit alcohol dehydrogenase family)